MLLLDAKDMDGLLDIDRSISELRGALNEQANGQVQMPARQTTDTQDGQNWLRISSAFLNGSGFMGFKAMNRAAGLGMRYMVGLYKIETGELLSLMDANWLTTRRTAATSAIGTDLMAPKGETTVGIIGSGVQARAFIQAYSTLRKIENIIVFSPREESRSAFAEWIENQLGIPTVAVSDPETVGRQCATTVLAMRAPRQPVFMSTWLHPGSHVTGLSSVRPEAREIDDDVWSKSDLVVVDDRGTVFQSGDGRSVAAKGIEAASIPELWELAAGKVSRSSEDQISLFKSSGNAMQDIAVAIGVYKLAIEQNKGRSIDHFPEVKPYD